MMTSSVISCSFLVTRKKNLKNWSKKLIIFWATWDISKKFSWKMWIMIILKVTKKQSFILSLSLWRMLFLEKPQGGGSNWGPPAFLWFIPKCYNLDFYIMWKLNIRRVKTCILPERFSIFFVYWGKNTGDWKLGQFQCFYERRGKHSKNMYVFITFQ